MEKKKKRKHLIIIVILLVFIIVMIGVSYHIVKYKKVFLNKLFISEQDIIGVDISQHQVDVDMEKLKEQNIQFIYMKATEGSSFQDRYFKENWANAKKAALPAGAYHFFSFESGGDTQAKNFIDTVGPLDGALIPVVDVEYYGGIDKNPPDKEFVVRELSKFLDALEKEYGVKP